MLRNFYLTLTFIWPFQIFQFYFNCHYFFIYWWIYLIFRQNKSYELIDMLDDFTWLLYDLDLQGQNFQFCCNCHYFFHLLMDFTHTLTKQHVETMTLKTCWIFLYMTLTFKIVKRCPRYVVTLVNKCHKL